MCSILHQVLVHVVSALFDINPSMSTHMPVHLWKKCAAVLLELLDLLKEHPNVVLDEAYEVCHCVLIVSS